MSNGSRSTFSSVHSSTTTNRCPSTQVTLKPPPKPPNPLLTPPAVPLGNADSGTTGHYFALRDSAHLTDVRPTSAPVSIVLPAGEIITSTHSGCADLPASIAPCAGARDPRHVDLFPQLTGSLWSIGQFADAGYPSIFFKDSVHVLDPNGLDISSILARHGVSTALSGIRYPVTTSYLLPLRATDYPSTPSSPHPTLSANASLYVHRSHADISSFFSWTLGSPVDSTYLRAASLHYLDSFPGLTPTIIRANLPDSIISQKGHQKKLRQGIRSTSVIAPDPTVFQLPSDYDPSAETFPTKPTPVVPLKHTAVYVRTFTAPTLESDGTGFFPVTSKAANRFINVAYFSCANYIKLTPAPSTSAKSEVAYYTHLLEFARSHNLTVSIVKLDNTYSKEVE